MAGLSAVCKTVRQGFDSLLRLQDDLRVYRFRRRVASAADDEVVRRKISPYGARHASDADLMAAVKEIEEAWRPNFSYWIDDHDLSEVDPITVLATIAREFEHRASARRESEIEARKQVSSLKRSVAVNAASEMNRQSA
jgi:hypothetical protein